MPAEWEPHRATWIAFPHHRTDWPGKLSALPWTFAELARVVAQGEMVSLLVKDGLEGTRARRLFERAGVDMSRLEISVAPTNRSWLRDSMPLWVARGRGAKRSSLAVNFRFDGWARYRDHRLDDEAGRKVAAWSVGKGRALEVFEPLLPDGARAVLEGGSIDVDGQGTLMTTSECLLESPRARFRKYGRDVCERILHESLGVEKVLWLPDGIAGDDTSGHIDDFARFAPGGRVLICAETDRKDENYAALKRARRALLGQTDARGRALELVELPMPKRVTYDGARLPASYANFYIANAAVVVPVFNDPADKLALDIIARCFVDRPVVGIYARDLVLGLGTFHCSTMQEPR